MISIEVTGVDEMRARLLALSTALRETIVADAVNAAAGVIEAAEQEAAPVTDETAAGSDALEPGELRDDIKTRKRRLDRDGFAVATVGPRKKRTRHAGRLVEYGHRLVKGSERKGNAHEIGSVPAHPFLRPAFERSANEAVEKFKETLREGIQKELR